MSFKDTLSLIVSDFERYKTESKQNCLKVFLFSPALWVIIVYRLRRYNKFEFNIPVIKPLFSIILNLLATVLLFLTGIELYPQTKIGKGLYLPHIGSIVFHQDAEIGDYCTILQGVTIGNGGRANNKGIPSIGSEVYIGAGAVILGKIKIGNNVAIGANAVVTKDIPDNAVAVGIPAKIISYEGSAGLIFYNKENIIQ